MKNYVFCEQIGNRIFHKYIDNQGKHQSEVLKGFPIELFVKGKQRKDSSQGLMGEVINKIEFTEIQDAIDFIKEYSNLQEIYGQTSLDHQFLNYYYPDDIQFKMNDITIMAIDLECAYDEQGFPSPDKANQEILAITCKVFGEKNPFVVFGTKPCTRNTFTYIQCQDESDLLTKFQTYWREVNPDILTGYNIEGFDIPYIINRCIQIKGEDFTKRFSSFSNNLSKCIVPYSIGERGESYKIVGITVLDYLELYKKFSNTTLESYRLEVVAQHELGTGKIDYSEYGGLMGLFEKNPEMYYYYNMIDTKLIEDLDSKLNFLFLAITIAYIGKIKFSEIYGPVKFWENYIYNTLKKKNIQIPPFSHKSREEIVGAYVKDPDPKMYSWIVTLDLTSLYPSIIMMANMSPETLVDKAHHTINDIEKYINMELDLDWAKEQNVSVIANGATFRRDKWGIFPELVDTMFNSRKSFKKKANEHARELEQLKQINASESEINAKKSEEATMNAKQQAFKIQLNSLYGACASPYFRYNSKDIAEGITLTGQLIIRFISQRLNIFLNDLFKTTEKDYVIACDTDSSMLNLEIIVNKMFSDQSNKQKIVNFLDKFVNQYIEPFLETEFAKLANYLNAYKNSLNMKREVIADRGLWRGKKHYILQVWDKEGIRYQTPKLKMMGIETAKSSTPKIVRGSLEKAIRIILNENEEMLQEYIKEFKKQFWEASAQEIAFPRGVSDMDKWIDKRGNHILKTPIHVKGSILYNKLIRKNKIQSTHPFIRNGDKIKFLYLKKQNPTQSNVIAFIDELPDELGLNSFIDKDIQFEKTFLDPLKSFAEIVGWNTEKTRTLDSFFS